MTDSMPLYSKKYCRPDAHMKLAGTRYVSYTANHSCQLNNERVANTIIQRDLQNIVILVI
jgi:hypothetical protein